MSSYQKTSTRRVSLVRECCEKAKKTTIDWGGRTSFGEVSNLYVPLAQGESTARAGDVGSNPSWGKKCLSLNGVDRTISRYRLDIY